MDTLIGLAMLYSWGHFIYLSFVSTWGQRNGYCKFVTVFAIATFVLFFIGVMTDLGYL